jgi:hypothetical protein
MLQSARFAIFIALVSLSSASAADPDRDFSGKWRLDADLSEMQTLPGDAYPVLIVEQKSALHCAATTASGSSVEWTYRLDGQDSKYQVGAESMNSNVKWEGPALLVNTLVSGTPGYTIMERWRLSRDRTQLNIERQIVRGSQQSEGYLVYRREGAIGAPPSSTGFPVAEPSSAGQPSLIRRTASAPPPPSQYTIPAGTHILLSLINPVSTKNSRDGDNVYLQTAVPVAKDGRIVIPKGSYVQGSVNKSKAAGRGSEKGELYIHFDTLTLPNGVTRDFNARVTSADSTNGKVDPDEGKISGTGRNTNPGTVGRDVGIGSMGGVIVGSAAGHPVTGLGVGAAAGIGAVLLSKNKDLVLPRGTSVEMVLDRDLTYTTADLRP